jgi:flagellar motor switch protein FliM
MNEEEVNQDDLAAAWGAEEGGDEAAAQEADAWGAETIDPAERRANELGERVLNQDEIDSLLGFDLGEDGAEKTGVKAIINSALVSYERLPMLEIVFDRLVRLMTTSLRNFTSDNVEVSLDNISSIRFGDYLNSIPLPAMLGVFRAEELDNFGLLTVESNLIYSIVDVLLGGRRGTAAMRVEGRPYTTIERVLVQRMIEVVLGDATAAFRAHDARHLRARPAGDQPALRRHRPARQRRHPGQAAHRHGRPRRAHRAAAALRHARAHPEDAAAAVPGEKFGRDNIWESHLATSSGPRRWRSAPCWTSSRSA